METNVMKRLVDNLVQDADNLNKLGKVVEVNTNNLNLLAVRLLKLEKRIEELENDKK